MTRIQQPLQQSLLLPPKPKHATQPQKIKNSNSITANAVQSRPITVDISAIGLKLSSLNKAAASLPSPQSGAALPVDYTNNIKRTGDKTIDPLLAGGNSWWNTGIGADGSNPSASADHTLTFGFIADSSGVNGNDATGFQALDSTQQDVVRNAFAYISSVVNITFTEDNSGGAQIKFGSNIQGGASAGYSNYPNSGSDSKVMLANDQSTFTTAASWDKGGYEWETIIHEIGHALGLKHPGNYNAGGGGTPKPYLSASLDNRTNSVMSYKNDTKNLHVVQKNGNQYIASYINPDSYQTLDIAALQYLYGAPNTAKNTYTFGDDGQFSRTIFDNNTQSTIDLSGMTQGNVVDLRGGHRSSIGIRDPYAEIGLTKDQYNKSGLLKALHGAPTYTGANNLGIAKGSKIQTVVGGSGSDALVSGSEIGGTASLDGGAGDDRFFIASGNATIADTSGSNDSVYVVKKAGTTWAVNNGALTQKDKNGATLATINLTGVEHVGFWSGKTVKAAGKLLYSPVEQNMVIAYGKTPAKNSMLSLKV